MWFKRKCPICKETFWWTSNRLIHVLMKHEGEIARRMNAAAKAFLSEPREQADEIEKGISR